MKKIPGLVGFIGESYQTLREDILLILGKFFQIIKKEGILLNSYSEAYIAQILKPNKNDPRKGNYTLTSLMNRGIKVLSKLLENLIHKP